MIVLRFLFASALVSALSLQAAAPKKPVQLKPSQVMLHRGWGGGISSQEAAKLLRAEVNMTIWAKDIYSLTMKYESHSNTPSELPGHGKTGADFIIALLEQALQDAKVFKKQEEDNNPKQALTDALAKADKELEEAQKKAAELTARKACLIAQRKALELAPASAAAPTATTEEDSSPKQWVTDVLVKALSQEHAAKLTAKPKASEPSTANQKSSDA